MSPCHFRRTGESLRIMKRTAEEAVRKIEMVAREGLEPPHRDFQSPIYPTELLATALYSSG